MFKQQDYYDLSGFNYNFYTEKQIELAAIEELNTGGRLQNNKEYFKKHPFKAFDNKFSAFDAYNDHYLLEIKRTSKDRDLCQQWGYDFCSDKFKRMAEYWCRNSGKQILILVLHGVKTWENRDEIGQFMSLNCKGLLYPVPIKQNNYLQYTTRYNVSNINCNGDGKGYFIFDYHDAEVFQGGTIEEWFETHFTGEKAKEWLSKPFGREKEVLDGLEKQTTPMKAEDFNDRPDEMGHRPSTSKK